MAKAYDPLDYDNLARSVVTALFESASTALPPTEKFSGSGVYALYYTGSLPFYSHIASSDLREPIYVGKAVPTGTRKGNRQVDSESSAEFHRRLHDHAKSIEQAENLDLVEFQVRYLVVMPVWITLAERFLINHFRPVRNTVIEGFGNHDPGRGRLAMRRPHWDIVHPGRPWAAKLQAAETTEEIVRLIGKPAR
ncbi:MAG: Eco29kI family restriction endonuclease [Nitrospira sp.]|nr:Eco29kI family restriction endonuclease [Nitrospira sp.]